MNQPAVGAENMTQIESEKAGGVKGKTAPSKENRINREKRSLSKLCRDLPDGKNQSGWKTTAALQAYNSTVKNYAAVCERLDRILPDNPVGRKLVELMRDG